MDPIGSPSLCLRCLGRHRGLQQPHGEVGYRPRLVAQELGRYQLGRVGEALGEVLAVVLGVGAGLGALLVAGSSTVANLRERLVEAGVERGGKLGPEGFGVGGRRRLGAVWARWKSRSAVSRVAWRYFWRPLRKKASRMAGKFLQAWQGHILGAEEIGSEERDGVHRS